MRDFLNLDQLSRFLFLRREKWRSCLWSSRRSSLPNRLKMPWTAPSYLEPSAKWTSTTPISPTSISRMKPHRERTSPCRNRWRTNISANSTIYLDHFKVKRATSSMTDTSLALPLIPLYPGLKLITPSDFRINSIRSIVGPIWDTWCTLTWWSTNQKKSITWSITESIICYRPTLLAPSKAKIITPLKVALRESILPLNSKMSLRLNLQSSVLTFIRI